MAAPAATGVATTTPVIATAVMPTVAMPMQTQMPKPTAAPAALRLLARPLQRLATVATVGAATRRLQPLPTPATAAMAAMAPWDKVAMAATRMSATSTATVAKAVMVATPDTGDVNFYTGNVTVSAGSGTFGGINNQQVVLRACTTPR